MAVSNNCTIGKNVYISETAQIWDYVHLRDGAKIGNRAIIGRNSYIGTNVVIGDDCKIQNFALIYEPATLERGVFIGPSVILTNDKFPRAINPNFIQKKSVDWSQVAVYIKEGASIGAGAVCIAPVTIGRWAMVAAGAVVTKDVPDFALVVGIPAKRVGWVSKTGANLIQSKKNSSIFICPETDVKFKEESNELLIELHDD